MNIANLFKYQPKNNYNFTLSTNIQKADSFNEQPLKTNISPYIDLNLKYMNSIYSATLSNDIIVRDFMLNFKNTKYKAFIFYIDGMVDTDSINDFILKPLMMKNATNTTTSISNHKNSFNSFENAIFAEKIKKNISLDYVYNSLVPQNSVNKVTEFSEIISSINSGNCALFIDTINTALDIDVKGFKQRSIDSPNNEIVIKGPQEAFVENIRTNTSMLRRIVNNENLVIEAHKVGKISKTKCSICYMKNIANNELVAEVKNRINNLGVDSVISTGQLEQLIEDNEFVDIPQMLSSERPDKCVKLLMQGRVVILVNGNPYALILPAVFKDFLSTSEDTNLKVLFANFLKLIRFMALMITLLLPGIYISITSFHQEILPTELLFSILAARQNVPFPIILELLIMEISFELIREGGLRVPSPIGSTMGIVGALILGDAAVSANIVSPILIIVVAITGLSSFAIPDFYFQFHARIYRFGFILLGYIAGFLGISLGVVAYTIMICNLKSFGVPFTSSFENNTKSENYFLPPIWKREYRDSAFEPKISKAQEHISKKWKFNN